MPPRESTARRRTPPAAAAIAYDGRMEPEASAPAALVCPKCSAAITAGEKFCAGCGAAIAVTGDGGVVAQDPLPSASLLGVRFDADAKLATARKWLLAVSILTLLSGLVFYGLQKKEVEDQIRAAETATAHLSAEERDAAAMQAMNMTWDQVVAHDRGMVTMLLVINLVLAVLYFGMWLWARSNALTAAVVALLLFLTTIVVSAVLEPKTLGQGIIVKIFFTAALFKAISAGYEARRRSA